MLCHPLRFLSYGLCNARVLSTVGIGLLSVATMMHHSSLLGAAFAAEGVGVDGVAVDLFVGCAAFEVSAGFFHECGRAEAAFAVCGLRGIYDAPFDLVRVGVAVEVLDVAEARGGEVVLEGLEGETWGWGGEGWGGEGRGKMGKWVHEFTDTRFMRVQNA